ncbi:hypothetical protein ACVXHA_12910 [Escherichia coli]
MAHRPRWTLSQVTELFEKRCWICCLKRSRCIDSISISSGAGQHVAVDQDRSCPDINNCPQSSRYKTGLEAERLMEVEQVLESARKAKAAGSTRFCMGAAWKKPPTNAICRTWNKWCRG